VKYLTLAFKEHLKGVKKVVFVALGRVLIILAGLVAVRAATTIMDPSQYGAVTQILSLAGLAFALLVTPLHMYVARRQLEWAEGGHFSVILSRLTLMLIKISLVTAAFAMLVQLIFPVLSSEFFSPWTFGAAIATFLLLNGLQIICTGSLLNFGYYRVYVLLNVLAVWCSLGLAVAGIQLFGTPTAWVLGTFLGYGVSLISFALLWHESGRYVASRKRPPARLDYGVVLLFGWPQVVCYVLIWMQTQSYRFITGGAEVLAVVGIIASGYSLCAVAMQAFESLFNEIYMPRMLKDLKFRDNESAARIWSAYADALVPAVLCFGAFLAFVMPYAVFLFLGERFYAAKSVVVILAAAEVFRAIAYQAVAQLGLALTDLRVAILPAAAGALGSLVFIPLLSTSDIIFGTAVGIMASYTLMLPISWLAVSRTKGAVWPVSRSLKSIAVSAPMIAGVWLFAPTPEWGVFKLLYIVAAAAIYMMACQFVLARRWLRA
jgi:O-antigen/teichoic acid export membrane protein